MAPAEKIETPFGAVSGQVFGSGDTGILLAHGAGTNREHTFMVGLADGLAGAGHTVMTFNYAYSERGVKRPDPHDKLVAVHRAAAEHLRQRLGALFLAGRSMGGRIATHLVAEGYPAEGVVLYAYPLHPPGREDRLRVDHLAEVRVPLLFFQGTRDALSRMEIFEEHIAGMPNATVEILEDADHSFRGGGWSVEQVLERLVGVTTSWIVQISSGTRPAAKP